MTAQEIRRHLQKLADPGKAKILQGFFKTGPGEKSLSAVISVIDLKIIFR